MPRNGKKSNNINWRYEIKTIIKEFKWVHLEAGKKGVVFMTSLIELFNSKLNHGHV